MNNLESWRVLIAEDHVLVRQGMAALLESHVGEVVEAGDGEAALHRLKSEAFDLALVDIGLPRRTGMDVLREVRQRKIAVKIIILTGDTDRYSPAEVYGAGADGFLYKTADADHFMAVIEAVAHDHAPPADSAAIGDMATPAAQLRDTLTPREAQIAKLVTEGQSNKGVAATLCISEHTVRTHREHINRKLGISSPAALAAFAIKAGLI